MQQVSPVPERVQLRWPIREKRHQSTLSKMWGKCASLNERREEGWVGNLSTVLCRSVSIRGSLYTMYLYVLLPYIGWTSSLGFAILDLRFSILYLRTTLICQ